MLANRYAQVLGSIFSNAGEKPYEVETVVAEVGASSEEDEIYRLTYDGSVAAEHGFAVMGGAAETLTSYVAERYQAGQPLASALALAVETLGRDSDEPRQLEANQLEVAVLDRTRTQVRKFRRLTGPVLERLLTPEPSPEPEATPAPATNAIDDVDDVLEDPDANPS
jgi:proteasome alpha subunit